MFESRLPLDLRQFLSSLPFRNQSLFNQPQPATPIQQSSLSLPISRLSPEFLQKRYDSPPTKANIGFRLYGKEKQSETTDSLSVESSTSEIRSESCSSPKIPKLVLSSKKIQGKASKEKKKSSSKKIYEISRFFIKNYVGALKATIHNPNTEQDIMEYLGCSKEKLIQIRNEFEQLIKENPKHNRMQLYKLMTNPELNAVFQYFLRRKVIAWIFTSSKMQDKKAHLMARKNFLYLCLNASSLTPNNFKIALNEK